MLIHHHYMLHDLFSKGAILTNLILRMELVCWCWAQREEMEDPRTMLLRYKIESIAFIDKQSKVRCYLCSYPKQTTLFHF